MGGMSLTYAHQCFRRCKTEQFWSSILSQCTCWAQALRVTNLALQLLYALAGIQHGPKTILQSIKPLLHFLLKGSLLVPAINNIAINHLSLILTHAFDCGLHVRWFACDACHLPLSVGRARFSCQSILFLDLVLQVLPFIAKTTSLRSLICLRQPQVQN